MSQLRDVANSSNPRVICVSASCWHCQPTAMFTIFLLAINFVIMIQKINRD